MVRHESSHLPVVRQKSPGTLLERLNVGLVVALAWCVVRANGPTVEETPC